MNLYTKRLFSIARLATSMFLMRNVKTPCTNTVYCQKLYQLFVFYKLDEQLITN